MILFWFQPWVDRSNCSDRLNSRQIDRQKRRDLHFWPVLWRKPPNNDLVTLGWRLAPWRVNATLRGRGLRQWSTNHHRCWRHSAISRIFGVLISYFCKVPRQLYRLFYFLGPMYGQIRPLHMWQWCLFRNNAELHVNIQDDLEKNWKIVIGSRGCLIW